MCCISHHLLDWAGSENQAAGWVPRIPKHKRKQSRREYVPRPPWGGSHYEGAQVLERLSTKLMTIHVNFDKWVSVACDDAVAFRCAAAPNEVCLVGASQSLRGIWCRQRVAF
mmetsp:Transcript_42554/g.118505  ORF Transcript_42554/g.118505 Transcript_42554/m.118505 type:complete len:112 (+) Transcript_42554:962-1297(+)